MAITVRKGYESQFDINKMLPGEFAITTDTHKVYVCMAAGISKELASVEELRNILDASDEAFGAFQELINAMEDGAVVTGLLNDVSNLKSGNYTISFSEAEERNNIESTDTIKVILGKIKKFFSSLSDVAFSGNYNDISNTPDLSEVALTGKSIDVTYDNSNSGLGAKDVQGAIDEVSAKSIKNASDINALNTKITGLRYLGTLNAGTVGNTINIDLTGVSSLYLMLTVSEDNTYTHIPVAILTKYISLTLREPASNNEAVENYITVTISGVKNGNPKVELVISNTQVWLSLAQVSFYGSSIV